MLTAALDAQSALGPHGQLAVESLMIQPSDPVLAGRLIGTEFLRSVLGLENPSLPPRVWQVALAAYDGSIRTPASADVAAKIGDHLGVLSDKSDKKR